MSAKYLSCAETAKLLRSALKESFPGVPFTVKSKTYSGGASIRVGWTDGPSSAEVKEVSDTFEGAYFDGMIDYQGSRYHKLCIEAVASYYGGCETVPSVEDYRNGNTWNWKNSGGCDLGRALSMKLQECGWDVAIQKSATLARVTFTGDDGYGQGTVGRNGTKGEGEQCYKAIAARQAALS
jgi:hypothetical protein